MKYIFNKLYIIVLTNYINCTSLYFYMTKKIILIADDEQDLVMMTKIKLESEGFRVIEAYDGEEVLRKIKEKPDLILLDIMMPKMDGFQVCAKLKKMKRPKRFLS